MSAPCADDRNYTVHETSRTYTSTAYFVLTSLVLSAGVFQLLQPHPDSSSSSSSSRNAVRDDQSTRGQVPCVFNLPIFNVSMLISAGSVRAGARL